MDPKDHVRDGYMHHADPTPTFPTVDRSDIGALLHRQLGREVSGLTHVPWRRCKRCWHKRQITTSSDTLRGRCSTTERGRHLLVKVKNLVRT